MRILSASIRGFRNLQEETFVFCPRVNLLLGRNGEGKTNLLEALNYFALGRSHRGSRNDELIAFDDKSLHVSLLVEEDSGEELRCEFGLDRNGGRRFRLDGEPIRRRSDLVGRLATVYFDPDSIHLVRGEPSRRRHFVDQGMSETDPLYLAHLTSFQKTLRQKNSLLRDMKRGVADPRRARGELGAWNRELATHAVEVCRGRAEYAALLTPHGDTAHRRLAGGEQVLEFHYRPALESVVAALTVDPEKPGAKEHLEREILAELNYIVETEIQRGRAVLGPQADDFEVRSQGLDLRVYGSQGETRSAAIALILARSDVLYQRRRVRPVIFFDDIFSELDRERSLRLQEMASGLHQVFIATARADDVRGWTPAKRKTWSVSAGSFTEMDNEPTP